MKRIAIILLMMVMSNPASSQWMQTSLGNNYSAGCFALSGSRIFTGTDSGIFLSSDNGMNWVPVDSGLTDSFVVALAVCGGNIFAGSAYDGVYLSTDMGASWAQDDSGLFGFQTDQILAFAVSGTNLFAGTGYGIYLSTDSGKSWNATSFPSTYVTAFAVVGTNIFTVTNDGPEAGIYLSTDGGTNWTPFDQSTFPVSINAFAVIDSAIFTGGLLGVYVSPIRGNYWEGVSSGLPNGVEPPMVTALVMSGSNLFAGTDSGIYLSTNYGESWTSENQGLTDSTDFSYSLIVNGSYIFAGTTSAGVWRRPLSDFGISGVAEGTAGQNILAPLAAPNPTSDATTISFSLQSDSYVKIEVFGVLGNKISSGFEGTLAAGNNAVPVSLRDIPGGIYYVRILPSGAQAQTLKLVKE